MDRMTHAFRSDRELDVVLFGATGFTGPWTAEYLAHHAPDGLRWGLAGRNEAKLEGVREHLGTIVPALGDLPLLTADVTDDASLKDVAQRARVVITTVGPYLSYGEPLVAACADAGTDYVDLTGEPEFVDRMYVAYHATAERTGAGLCMPAASTRSRTTSAPTSPSRLPDDVPITLRGVVCSRGTFSGGTFHSAMMQMSRAKQMEQAHAARRAIEPRPDGRSSRAVSGKPQRDAVLSRWLLPLPTIDPMIVARSGAALPAYGPEFRFSDYAGTKTLRYAVGGAVGVGAIGLKPR